MILYTPVSGYACENRYYIKFGDILSFLFSEGNGSGFAWDYLEEWRISPFNPFFTEKVNSWDFSEQSDRRKFLVLLWGMCPRILCATYYPPYNPIMLPLPLYPDTDATLAINYEIMRELLLNYILPQYWDDYLSVYSISDSEEDIDKAYNSWFTKFMAVFSATQRKYITLIKCLKEKEGKLLDKVGSSSIGTTRYNDTPQNSGTFEDPTHNTNFTRHDGEVASDIETPIKRLEEIKNSLEDYYTSWALLFDKLFVKEGSIE